MPTPIRGEMPSDSFVAGRGAPLLRGVLGDCPRPSEDPLRIDPTTDPILQLGPGMTADVNLIGDKRSVTAYILTPFTRLGEEAFRE